MDEEKVNSQNAPIDVLPGSDPDLIGRHYKKLHQHFYSLVNAKVDVDYTKKKLPGGKTRVQIVVKRK